ncbi:MAG: hypothetical protein M0019_02760 [Actinomycetota bacterium]|nr:hypothetical protein [Actinomycetota bacterium]
MKKNLSQFNDRDPIKSVGAIERFTFAKEAVSLAPTVTDRPRRPSSLEIAQGMTSK